MKELLERLSSDWASVFESENLVVLAAMSDVDFARFLAEVRARKAKIGITELKKAVKEYRRREKAAAAGLEVLDDRSRKGGSVAISDIWPGELVDVELPPGYTVRGEQVFRLKVTMEGKVSTVPVSTGPLYVSRELECIDAGPDSVNRYRREVRFRVNGSWKSIQPWVATLETPRKFAELLSSGLPTDHTMIRETMLYLTDFAKHNKITGKLPVIRTTSISGRVTMDDMLDTVYIVYPGGVWSVNGPEENPPVVYAADATPDSLEGISPLSGGSQEEARQVMELLAKCAEPITVWMMLGWFSATLIAPVVRLAWNEFPILNIYGGRGTGKSSLTQLVSMAFFGTGSLGTARRPPFSLIREMSATNTFPVILDEYRIYEMRDDHRDTLHHLLRHGYRAGRESRGRHDQTTVDYHLTAPVALVGESAVEDAAIRQRSVILPVSRAIICDYHGAREAYRDLIALGPDALRRTAGWLWCRALEVAGHTVADVIDAIYALDTALAAKISDIPDRVRHGMAIVAFGIGWLAKTLDLDIIPPHIDEIAKKYVIAHTMQEETPLAEFIRFLDVENCKAPRDRKIPMRASGNYIYIHQETAIAGYADYARRLRLQYLGKDSLLQEIRERTDICVATSAVREIGVKKAKCMVLSVAELERQFGIPADSWPTAWPVGSGDDDCDFPF